MAHVLVVEDNKTLNQAYKLILQREGHIVRTAANGRDALKLIEIFEPDTILLDILMPVMGGVEFLEHYKPKQHPKTTIVILSNLNDDGAVRRALELGAHTYILKASASPQALLAEVTTK